MPIIARIFSHFWMEPDKNTWSVTESKTRLHNSVTKSEKAKERKESILVQREQKSKVSRRRLTFGCR